MIEIIFFYNKLNEKVTFKEEILSGNHDKNTFILQIQLTENYSNIKIY